MWTDASWGLSQVLGGIFSSVTGGGWTYVLPCWPHHCLEFLHPGLPTKPGDAAHMPLERDQESVLALAPYLNPPVFL